MLKPNNIYKLPCYLILSVLLLINFTSNASYPEKILKTDAPGTIYPVLGSCRWSESNNTVTIEHQVTFPASIAGYGRTVKVMLYDKNGHPLTADQINRLDIHVFLNNNEANVFFRAGTNYSVGKAKKDTSNWHLLRSFLGTIKIVIPKTAISPQWPAVTITTGTWGVNYNQLLVNPTKHAYITPDTNTAHCPTISNPNVPPAPPFHITVRAPDWDLGELQSGKHEKTLSTPEALLCIDYNHNRFTNQKILLSGINSSGTADTTHFKLKNTQTIATIPYKLILKDTKRMFKEITIPNGTLNSFPLNDSSNTTCFEPTFETNVAANQAPGNYTDTITFIIKEAT